jgi:hypothetical protein
MGSERTGTELTGSARGSARGSGREGMPSGALARGWPGRPIRGSDARMRGSGRLAPAGSLGSSWS